MLFVENAIVVTAASKRFVLILSIFFFSFCVFLSLVKRTNMQAVRGNTRFNISSTDGRYCSTQNTNYRATLFLLAGASHQLIRLSVSHVIHGVVVLLWRNSVAGTLSSVTIACINTIELQEV